MQSTDINAKIFEIISNIPDGQFIFVENVADGISNWTRDAVDYFGLPGINTFNTKEIMRSMVHPDDLERWEQEMEAVFSLQRDSFFFTYQIRNAKGDYVPCTGKGKLILGENGAPLIFAGSMTIHQGEEANDAITDLPKFQTFLKHVSETKKEKKNVFYLH